MDYRKLPPPRDKRVVPYNPQIPDSRDETPAEVPTIDGEFRVFQESAPFGLRTQPGKSALIVWANEEVRGEAITARLLLTGQMEPGPLTHANVVEKQLQGKRCFVAIFPVLRAGDYNVYARWTRMYAPEVEVTTYDGLISEVDWR